MIKPEPRSTSRRCSDKTLYQIVTLDIQGAFQRRESSPVIRLITLSIAFLFICHHSLAQAYLLTDIYTGNKTNANPAGIVLMNGVAYFSATNGTTGVELWRSDGTAAGTRIVADINSGSGSSTPTSLTVNGSTLYFTANNGTSGVELWKSDGTSVGTSMVKDIRSGATGSIPASLKVRAGILYFSANDGTTGIELWRSDGTSAGTTLVKDIRSGSNSSTPTSITAVGSAVLFAATDGTNGIELWKSDGTNAGTTLVKNIRTGSNNSSPTGFVVVGSMAYFAANDGTVGNELWKSDGTTAGTVLVKDIYTGATASNPANIVVASSKLVFAATDATNGTELWTSDGSAAGTTLLKNIRAGNNSSSPVNLSAQSNKVYFSANDGTTSNELWVSDATAAGTVLLKDINTSNNGSSNPSGFFIANSTVYFAADNKTNGVELWQTDGTTAGTQLTADINLGTQSSSPSNFVYINDTLMFSADDGTHGVELFALDPTPPSVEGIVRNGTTTVRSATVTFTVTFTEDVTGVNAADFTLTTTGLTGVSISTITETSPRNYVVTVSTGAGDGTIRLSLTDDDTILDLAGNPLGGTGTGNGSFATLDAFTVDKTAPTVSLFSGTATTTNVAQIGVGITFSEQVTGFTIDDLVVGNGAITAFTGSGTTYAVLLEPNTEGVATINLAANKAYDVAGNGNAVATTFSRTYDATPPQISIGAPSATTVRNGTVTYLVTYAGQSAITLTPAAITLNKTGTASGTIGSVSGTGAAKTVSIGNITGTGTLGISIAAGTASDAAGNLAPQSSASSLVNVDNSAPTVEFLLDDSSPTNKNVVRFRATFSESTNGTFTAADLALTGSLAAQSQFQLSGADPSYFVSVTPNDPDADGTIALQIGTSVTDVIGNAFAGDTSDEYTIDNARPTIQIGTPTPTSLQSGEAQYTVTYSGEDNITLSAPNITVTKTGTATGTITSVTGTGHTRVVTIGNISGTGTLGLNIGTDTASDNAGNFALAAASATTVQVDSTIPTAVIVQTDPNPTNAAALHFAVNFSESIGDSFTVDDITLAGSLTEGAIVSITGDGQEFIVTVEPAETTIDGTIGIVVGQDITDATGNAYLGGTSSLYSVDYTAPLATVELLDANPSSADSVDFGVTFTENIGQSFTTEDIQLTGTLATSASISVSGSGTSYTVNVTPADPDENGTLGITIDGNIVDAAGNMTPLVESDQYVIDNSQLLIEIGPPSSTSVFAGASVSYLVTYSGADTITLPTSSIVVNTTGTATATVESILGEGDVRLVTLSGIAGEGTVSISLIPGTASATIAGSAPAVGPSASFAVTVEPDNGGEETGGGGGETGGGGGEIGANGVPVDAPVGGLPLLLVLPALAAYILASTGKAKK